MAPGTGAADLPRLFLLGTLGTLGSEGSLDSGGVPAPIRSHNQSVKSVKSVVHGGEVEAWLRPNGTGDWRSWNFEGLHANSRLW